MGMNLNMDYSQVDPSAGGRTYLPPSDSKGWLVIISDSKPQETKDKTGTMLVLDIVGQEGVVMGKAAQHNINVMHADQAVMARAAGECSAIAHALGHLRVGNSAEWHGKPLRVVIALDEKNQEAYPGSTRVVGWRTVNGDVPKPAGQGALSSGTQQAGNFAGNPGQGQPAFGNNGGQQQFQQNNQFQPNNGNVQQQQFQPSPQQMQQTQQQFQPSGQQQFQQGQPGQFVQNGGTGFDPNTGQPINNGQQQFQQGQNNGQPGWTNG